MNKTKEKASSELLQSAMRHGTLLGSMWIVAFATYILSLTSADLSLIFLLLLAASPIYAGYLGIKYRKNECNNKLSFVNAWSYMIILYLCASILSAIACYIYFQFMDNGVALSAFKEQIDIYTTLDIGEEMKKALTDTFEILANMDASDYCMQYLSSNVFLTTFLAPITAIFIYKK